jgi:hypothetical protein
MKKSTIEDLAAAFGAGLLVIAILVFASALTAFPVKWLWNWLMPTIFGLRHITVFQAWGLAVLCGFLFTPRSPKKTD